ncbi:MAG: Vacuolar protease A [Chaenotheca gracillima]|nr:MAG: Vacuolar protease A [Chaenotheca gracillima]
MGTHTVTGLKRWSCQNEDLPGVDAIKSIHVYDFDNTLFRSPLPNLKLWNSSTYGRLQQSDAFVNGGWWHDSTILAATGDGVEKEEPRGWRGWWNEDIASLVQLSMQQKDALKVLLTGRSEKGFRDLIKRMVASKNLEFDMVCLKPEVGPRNETFSSTMVFKKALLADLLYTYKDAEEIKVYEDRVRHVKAFREYLTGLNRSMGQPYQEQSRKNFNSEVIPVAEGATTLDPVIETAEVQRMINEHNTVVVRGRSSADQQLSRMKIKRTILFTGYMISEEDSSRLASLAPIPTNRPEGEITTLASNILITPRPCPPSVLNVVGGLGRKMTWEVTGTAVLDNRLWAACCRPVPPTARYHTDNPTPAVVLATRKGTRPADVGRIQNWQPVPQDRAFKFTTEVGEKVLLRIEEDNPHENEYDSLFPRSKGHRKKHGMESDSEHQAPRGGGNPRSGRGAYRGNRGGGRGGRGGGRGGGDGASRGGYGNYRSLDDPPNDRDFNSSGGGWGNGNYAPPRGPGPSGGGGYVQY